MIFRKYIFPKSVYESLQPSDSEVNPKALHGAVNLGHPELTPLVLDPEGEVIKEATYDTKKVCVDVLLDEPRPDLEKYAVWPKTPNHVFAGWEELYHAERLAKK